MTLQSHFCIEKWLLISLATRRDFPGFLILQASLSDRSESLFLSRSMSPLREFRSVVPPSYIGGVRGYKVTGKWRMNIQGLVAADQPPL